MRVDERSLAREGREDDRRTPAHRHAPWLGVRLAALNLWLGMFAACAGQRSDDGALEADIPSRPEPAAGESGRDAASSDAGPALGFDAGDRAEETDARVRTSDDARAAPTVDDWPSYGRDLAQTRDNSVQTEIVPSTVAGLKRLWTWEKSAVTSSPAYYDGKVYFGDWQGYAVALDARTGRELWRVLLPEQAVAQVTGSVAVDERSVYVGSDASYYRLERATGAVVWRQAVSGSDTSPHVYSSPAVAAGIVVGGVGSYQNVNPIADGFMQPPFRGAVHGLDMETGVQRWKFELTTGKGVGVTSSAAVDLPRRRVFIGTGQNYDNSDSPYADSLLALDLETGAHVWHAQFTKNDIYSLAHLDGPDHDVLAAPMLWSHEGIEGVAVGDKGGSFFVLDRDGKPLWAKKLTPGGHHGGVMGSSAYHEGVFYICSGDFTTDQTIGLAQDGPSMSLLLALRARDGTEVWTKSIEGLCYGAVTHAGGVVFLPAGSGHIRAYSADTGAELWSDQLPKSSAGGVSVTNGMVFVPYGWDWIDTSAQGGLIAYGLR